MRRQYYNNNIVIYTMYGQRIYDTLIIMIILHYSIYIYDRHNR